MDNYTNGVYNFGMPWVLSEPQHQPSLQAFIELLKRGGKKVGKAILNDLRGKLQIEDNLMNAGTEDVRRLMRQQNAMDIANGRTPRY